MGRRPAGVGPRHPPELVSNFAASGALSTGDVARADRTARRGLAADPEGIFAFWGMAGRCYLGAALALQAALGVADRPGVLSGPFAALPPDRRERALAAVLELPDEVGLISLRELGPVVANLRARHQLNILSIEAVAAAVQLRATVALSARSPRLEDALAAEGRPVEIVR